MFQTFAFMDRDHKQFFEKLIDDLNFALENINSKELFLILKRAKASSTKTSQSRYYIFFVSITRLIIWGKKLFSRPTEKVQNVYTIFLKIQKKKQIEIIIETLIALFIYFMSTEDADIDCDIPESDIEFIGIGTYYSPLTHSIISSLGLETAGRFSINLLPKVINRMPIDCNPIWGQIYNYLINNEGKEITDLWMGLGTQLIKDLDIFKCGVKAYNCFPININFKNEKSLLVAEGVANVLLTPKCNN